MTVLRKVILANDNLNSLGIDLTTRVPIGIDYAHHEIHSGSHYFICGYDSFDAADDIDFQVVTPAGLKRAHMTFNFQSTGETVFSIYEDADFDLDGTTVTPRNNNRNCDDDSMLTVQYDGTVNAAGTLIYSASFGFTDNPTRSSGGVALRENEIILKADASYRFFVESNSAANIITYCGEWYEHTDKSD